MDTFFETITIEQAIDGIKKYKYALIYMISEQIFDYADNIENLNWDECLEARFFDQQGEIHIFKTEGELKAVETKNAITMSSNIYSIEISDKYSNIGKTLSVMQYLDQDSDGQVFVVGTRLYNVE